MHELGASSRDRHAGIGTLASELGIDHLVCVAAPEYADGIGTNCAMDVHLLEGKSEALALVTQMRSGDVILVKASRAETFEEIAQGITDQLEKMLMNVEEGEGQIK
jgi:UDP-N-acetylmuramoyl-tripeptide--D-alanyl-D-alanine ligase